MDKSSTTESSVAEVIFFTTIGRLKTFADVQTSVNMHYSIHNFNIQSHPGWDRSGIMRVGYGLVKHCEGKFQGVQMSRICWEVDKIVPCPVKVLSGKIKCFGMNFSFN